MGASRAVLIPRIKPRRCTGGTDVPTSSRENDDPVTPASSGRRASKVHHATPALEPRRKPPRQPLANCNVDSTPKPRTKPAAKSEGGAQKAADALRRHADEARTEGTKAVRQAVEDDHAGKLESAVALYAKALRYFEVYLRLERNKQQTDAVRPKVEQYRARLAKLREVVTSRHAAQAGSGATDESTNEAAEETRSNDQPSDKRHHRAARNEAPPRTELKVVLPRGDSTFVLAPLRSVVDVTKAGATKEDGPDEWSLEDGNGETEATDATDEMVAQVDVEREWEEFERKVRDSPEVELEAAVLEERKKSPAKEAAGEPAPAPEPEPEPEPEPALAKTTEDADSLAAESDSDVSYVWDGLSGGEYGMWSDNDGDDEVSDEGSDAGSDSFDIDGAVNAWTSWATSKLDTHLKNLNTKYQSSWAPAVDRLREQAKKKFEQEWAAQFPSDEEYRKELGSKEYPSELNYALPEVPLAERMDEDPAVAKKVS